MSINRTPDNMRMRTKLKSIVAITILCALGISKMKTIIDITGDTFFENTGTTSAMASAANPIGLTVV